MSFVFVLAQVRFESTPGHGFKLHGSHRWFRFFSILKHALLQCQAGSALYFFSARGLIYLPLELKNELGFNAGLGVHDLARTIRLEITNVAQCGLALII